MQWAIIIGAVALLLIALNAISARRGGTVGRDVIVRCSKGHLFTTTWIAGVSVKAIRLGNARVQRCPVCGRWTRVVRVPESELSDEDRRVAASHKDSGIP